MPLINQVKEMQQQGLSEQEIAQKLAEQGYQPLQINEALEQAKIKSAISENQMQYPYQIEEMQPSVMAEQEQTPAPIEEAEQPTTAQPPQYIYPTPTYPQYAEYQPYSSTETITEIAEQISEEKLGQIKKEIGNISEFKLKTEKRIEDIDDRLKKIEEMIDKLQATILGKIGSYGQNLQDIKQEMGMMQESFSKALNPLIEKTREKEEKQLGEQKTEEKRSKKRSNGFEHYLRR